jgi:hypothetical protein
MTQIEEQESGHGKLTALDQRWTGERFVVLLLITLTVALAIIFVSASVGSMDFSWDPFAHDLVKHTVETSTF